MNTVVFVFHLVAWIAPPSVTDASGKVTQPPPEYTFIREYTDADECVQAARTYPESARAACIRQLATTGTTAQ